jgi:hypothetical protein
MLIPFILPSFRSRSMFTLIKEKLSSTITEHPKLVTFAIGFAITFTMGTAIGMFEQGHLSWDVFANRNRQCFEDAFMRLYQDG